ncbi:hypothetical protein BDV23DRAFT_178482 [Aspergillus alliaceus]|uniref:Uncharacterized protein n=1 Tax=Petromyces alliaceus TaxID=209559 RepID=A0A5N7CMK6_PETAA|nr:hypothetical protein BDV23DRAFT_178482 [Aspergillus alliaceus]
MGLPGGHGIVGTEPEWLEAVELFHKSMRKHDKPYSGFCLAKGDSFLKGKSHMSMCIVAGDTLKLETRIPIQLSPPPVAMLCASTGFSRFTLIVSVRFHSSRS